MARMLLTAKRGSGVRARGADLAQVMQERRGGGGGGGGGGFDRSEGQRG